MHLLPLFYRDIREPTLHFLPGTKSRQEFHRVIFVLKAKGKGTMPWRHHETMGVDLARQNSGEWSFKVPDLSSHSTTAAKLYCLSRGCRNAFHHPSHDWPSLNFIFLIRNLNKSRALLKAQCLKNKLVLLSQ